MLVYQVDLVLWVAPAGCRGQLPPHMHLLLPPAAPQGEILMVIKCPLATIHMPRCDFLNKIIFARQYRRL